MTRFIPQDNFRSWGNVLKTQHHVARPVWRDQLRTTLLNGRQQGLSLLGAGLRRSYGDSGLNPGGGMIDMTGLDRIIHFDPGRRVLRAEAGMSFDTLLQVIVRQGFFLPVTPGTRYVTLGGAVGNDVHGKNHHVNGPIGRWVRRLGLLRSSGEELELSPSENPELFAATIGGLGLTGLITWVELELIAIESAMIDAENIPFENVDAFFALAKESEEGFDYTVSWIDCLAKGASLGRGLFSRGNHAKFGSRLPDQGNTRFTMPMNLPGFAMNRYSIDAFNALYYWNGKRKAGPARIGLHPFFYPLDSIDRWNRLYGRVGMYQYQSVVPPATQVSATKEMLKAISDSGQGSFLAVLKTFGAVKSPGMLSFPKEGTTLALDFPNHGEGTLRLMKRLDAIVLEAGGRLYPAKDGRMSAEMFQQGYPTWQAFSQHVDHGFSSHFWQRVSQ
ncbi:FAD-binding oxidoreductase [Agrobacterium salinitolerans]|uniref:FAD-binding oxidoreductase n=1 Tax=Agrobacterium salinitolerans TaxID=1183413 RepID=UPI001573577E|nr:FAD-binding oxidoreductase [Agrobacterium salinitolerans]NTA39806.1 FAD-binding oxidoreductase [Agrobacterium salinitolerans]